MKKDGGKLCYNRGCGRTFDPSKNFDDSCRYHSGAPVFHDAYKSWSCCGRKTTDFSSFLATPGCALGLHSNVKAEEPVKITGDKTEIPDDVEEIREPLTPSALVRPPFESALARLKPATDTAPKNVPAGVKAKTEKTDGKIAEGENCKNGGCKETYSEETTDDGDCVYHDGIPVFHEGLKFWSCCRRKTSDFQSFLDQKGCRTGSHVWVKAGGEGSEKVECRHDWHQTAGFVTIAVYAKNYDSGSSYAEINPIRVKIHVSFPEQNGFFDMDRELKGIIIPEESSLHMYGTKIEIKLKKAEPGHWSRLDIPKTVKKDTAVETPKPETIAVDAPDLDDLDLLAQKVVLSKEASGGRTSAEII